jgi:hypothetical protein
MTYTEQQIIAIGGRLWERDTRRRVYLNDWPSLAGFEYSTYKTGNISSASLGGERLSNTKATALTTAKVWWEDGEIRTTLGQAADRVNLDGAAIVARLHEGIAAAVKAARREPLRPQTGQEAT